MKTFNLVTKSGEKIYSCEAEKIGDAIRKANAEGIVCKNLDWAKSVFGPDMHGRIDDDYIADLKGLSLEGLRLIVDSCVGRYENEFVDMNLRYAEICLNDVEDGSVGYYNCDLRGATFSSGFQTTISNCIFDRSSKFPSICGVDSYDVINCDYVFNDNDKMKFKDMKVFFFDFKNGLLKHSLKLMGMKILDTLTDDVNVLVTKDVHSTAEEIENAKKRGCKVVSFASFFRTFVIYDIDEYGYNSKTDRVFRKRY